MRWAPMILLFAAGCGRNLTGWWTLDLWQIERDGETIERADAGFLLWQDVAYGGFTMGLRYRYDADAFDLVPADDPTTLSNGPSVDDIEDNPVGEPDLTLYLVDGDVTDPLELDIVDYRATEMTLETVEPLWRDGSMWRWELSR